MREHETRLLRAVELLVLYGLYRHCCPNLCGGGDPRGSKLPEVAEQEGEEGDEDEDYEDDEEYGEEGEEGYEDDEEYGEEEA